jgi:hypothetical protein
LEDNPAALEASSITRTAKGRLLFAAGFNSGASDLFFQVFDAVAVPADGTIPRLSLLIPAGGTFGFSPRPDIMKFDNGIVWCVSTTVATKTIAGALAWIHVYHTDYHRS